MSGYSTRHVRDTASSFHIPLCNTHDMQATELIVENMSLRRKGPGCVRPIDTTRTRLLTIVNARWRNY